MADYDRVGPQSDINTALCRGKDPAETISQALGEIVQNPPAPTGIMVWWTGTAASIPSGWALMDGSDNSVSRGGSGFNLVGRFVLAAASGAGTTSNGRTGTSSHQHDVIVSSENVGLYGNIESKGSGVSQTGGAIYSSPEDVVSGNPTGNVPDSGAHRHSTPLEEVTVELSMAGGHDHPGADTPSKATPAHSAADVVGCIDDHAAHTHNITTTNTSNIAATGSTTIHYLDAAHDTTAEHPLFEHEAAGGGAALSHAAHTHTVDVGFSSGHSHPVDPHTHEVLWQDDGSHGHTVGTHTHPVTLEDGVDHVHAITDTGHTHPFAVWSDFHSHPVSVDSGMHDHEAGTPAHMQLLPIEKLSRVVLA